MLLLDVLLLCEQLLECYPFGYNIPKWWLALETRPSCARLGQPGAAVSTQPLDGPDARPTCPSPHKLGAPRSSDGGHGFFVRFEFPFLGSVDAALTMEMLSELERLLQ